MELPQFSSLFLTLRVKWGTLLADSILVSFSPMIKQAEQSLACLKCLLDVKQLIGSCFLLPGFLEISKSIRTDSCFLNFLKTPYLSPCEKANLAGCALEMLPGCQLF